MLDVDLICLRHLALLWLSLVSSAPTPQNFLYRPARIAVRSSIKTLLPSRLL